MRKKFIPVLIAISILALVLRAVVCVQLYHAPDVLEPNVQTDMATYIRLAKEILSGNWPDHYDYQPFYYTVFLPACLFVARGSLVVAIGLQALVGALAVYLVGLGAAQLYGRKAGLVAAALLALARFHIFYTPFMLYEVLNSFWLALLFHLLLRAWKKNTWTCWLLGGLALSAAALTRGNALLWLPGVLVFAWWRNRRQWKRALGLVAALVALFYLPQLPFSITNYKFTGRWCGASTAGDKVLALGNTPEAPPGGLEYPLTYHAWVSDSDKRPEEGRVSVPRRIIDWFACHPAQVVELQFRKLLLFWNRMEIPNNVSIDVHGKGSSLLQFPLLVPFWLFAVPALAALLCCWRRGAPRQNMLFFLVLMYCFGTVLFYILARFRIGGVPLLCVLAAAFVQKIINVWQQRTQPTEEKGRQRLVLTGLGLALALFAVCSAFTLYQDLYEADVMKALRPNGVMVERPQDVLFYDHGPLTVGGLSFMSTDQASSLALDKRLVIAQSPQCRELKGKPFTVRILFQQERRGENFKASFTHAGETVFPRLVQDRFMTWLEADFQHLDLNDDGTATVTFTLHGSQNNMVGIDRLRCYGRTESPTAHPCPFEAFLELQVKR